MSFSLKSKLLKESVKQELKDLPQAEVFEFDATFDVAGQEDPFSKNKPIKNGDESTA